MLNPKGSVSIPRGGLVVGRINGDVTQPQPEIRWELDLDRAWSQLYIKGRIEETRSEVVGFY